MYIGAENIISPLGSSAQEVFEKMSLGISSLSMKDGIIQSSFNSEELEILPLMKESISESISKVNKNYLSNSKTLLIVSTTKGEINSIDTNMRKAHLYYLSQKLSQEFDCVDKGIVLSTACVSGLQSLIIANDMINNNYYENVIVCGGDLASNFVIEGFTCFYALSDKPCAPFDKERKGLNIGEAVSTIILSKVKGFFKETPFWFTGGCSVNDASHISAPHREGEGLVKSIKNTLKISSISVDAIDFINAHGTATLYNDEMEAKTFLELGFANTPINSLKGFFGHTLGASGVIETAISLQSMRHNLLLKCKGFSNQDFKPELDILTENRSVKIDTILKTSSGFGGFNASAIIQRK